MVEPDHGESNWRRWCRHAWRSLHWSRVKIAIVGTGFIAETRARAYSGVTGYPVQLVAAVSRTRDRAESNAKRHAIPDAYTSLEQVLDRADIDVVDLCVPNYLHRPMTQAAAAAGKHVIRSKP